MRTSVGLWHQHVHVGADDLRLADAEQPFGRLAEGQDPAAGVDHHHRIGHG